MPIFALRINGDADGIERDRVEQGKIAIKLATNNRICSPIFCTYGSLLRAYRTLFFNELFVLRILNSLR